MSKFLKTINKLLYYWNNIELYNQCVIDSEKYLIKFYYRNIRDFYKYLLKNDLGIIIEKNTYNN